MFFSLKHSLYKNVLFSFQIFGYFPASKIAPRSKINLLTLITCASSSFTAMVLSFEINRLIYHCSSWCSFILVLCSYVTPEETRVFGFLFVNFLCCQNYFFVFWGKSFCMYFCLSCCKILHSCLRKRQHKSWLWALMGFALTCGWSRSLP